jgi:hypothetical protein
MLVIQLNDNSRFEHMIVPREGLKPRREEASSRGTRLRQPRALYQRHGLLTRRHCFLPQHPTSGNKLRKALFINFTTRSLGTRIHHSFPSQRPSPANRSHDVHILDHPLERRRRAMATALPRSPLQDGLTRTRLHVATSRRIQRLASPVCPASSNLHLQRDVGRVAGEQTRRGTEE